MEKRTFVVYEKFMKDSGKVVYVGMGSDVRANEKHRSDTEFNNLVDVGFISTKIVYDKLTEGEAKEFETLLIKKYGIDNLYNKTKGTSGYENQTLDRPEKGIDKIIELLLKSTEEQIIKDKTTPKSIVDEILNKILNNSGFDIENKKILNPVGRIGEFYKYLTDRVGIESVRNNYTMLEKDQLKFSLFLAENINGESVENIKIINKDFNDFETNEKYDVIIMNPPFVKLGEKFILKAMDMLTDKGFLGCVMSPIWKSVVLKETQHRKAYTQMVKTGGFHYIHMYSNKKTSELFNQSIGQVDVFVWQKGVKVDKTEIINVDDEQYYYDLTNYTQTVPVMPAYIYNKYFDQANGSKWYRFGSLRDTRNESYGKVDIEFFDEVTGKKALCNKANVEKTKGKKVIVDRDFNRYYVDNIGDSIVNDRYMFFFDTNQERDNIVKTLDYVIDNNKQHLFRNTGRFVVAHIPGIKNK